MNGHRMNPLATRSAELRRRHRKVLGWSLAGGLLLHLGAALLITWPDAEGRTILGEQMAAGAWTGPPIAFIFGPPTIRGRADGGSDEVVDRTLEAERSLPLPAECGRTPGAASSAPARLHLRLDEQGRVSTLSLAGSTGDPCWDAVAMEVAPHLHYQWLPSPRFPHPVELEQPVWMELAAQ